MMLFLAVMFCAAAAPELLHARTKASSAETTTTALLPDLNFRILKQHRARGGVIGILDEGTRSIVAVHDERKPREAAVDGDTIFEIASLTKIFTAYLLADATVRGEARLEDPLADCVPPGTVVPRFGEQPIRLIDLATHGSGLPLRPNDLDGAPDAPNKYAGYSAPRLFAGLSMYRLERAPGTAFEYSNVAFGVLGACLSLKLKQSYDALLSSRITQPLQMTSTQLGDDPKNAARRAVGHDSGLRPMGATDDGALNPAGGLRSTANDLLAFLAVFVDKAASGTAGMSRAAQLMLTVDRPGDASNTRMALGWRRTVSNGETYYWSNGSGDGSRTFMGFNPSRNIAVVALANAASADGLDDIARWVLDPKQPVDRHIARKRSAIPLTDKLASLVIGMYAYAPDDRIEITRGATGLILTAGKSQVVIYPESRTRYFAKVTDSILVDFEDVEGGSAKRLILRQDGKAYVYKRTP